jgi:hypothetical protein
MLRVGTKSASSFRATQLFPALLRTRYSSPRSAADRAAHQAGIKARHDGVARMASLSEVPTMTEAGVPEVQYNGWVGLFMPGGSSRDIADRISGVAAKMLRMPDVAKYYPAWGVEPVGNTPDAFRALYHSEVERFIKLIREAKIPQAD